MSDSPAVEQTTEPERDSELEQTPEHEQSSDATARDQPLAESGQSPERVEHVGVSEHDDVDQDALDIAESTSSDEPPA